MRALLALDTADGGAGVAVVVGGQVVAWEAEPSRTRAAERLFPLVDGVLARGGVGIQDLGCVAVSRGPGSFTGLRVGIAAAKGIAFALGIPVVGVPTLGALARGAGPGAGAVAAVLDARKGQVYAAAYAGATEVVPEGAWRPEAFAAAVADLGEPCRFTGSGLVPYGALFRDRLGAAYRPTPEDQWGVPPTRVGELGWEGWAAGEAVPPARLVPEYRRLSEAEEAKAAAAPRP